MNQVVTAGALLSLVVVSVVLLVRRPRHPVTLVLTVITVAAVLNPVAAPFLVNTVWALAVLPLSALLVVFPDGPRGPGWHRVFQYVVVAIGLGALLVLIPSAGMPLTIVASALALSVMPVAVAAVVSLVRLWRRSVGERRFRIGLVLAAGLVLVTPILLLPVLWLLWGEDWDRVNEVANALYAGLMFTLVPLAVGVSMLLEPVGRRSAWVERTWPWLLGAGAALLVGGTVVELAVALGASAGSPLVVAVTSLAVAGCVGWVVGLVRRSPYRLVSADDRAARALRELAERLDSVPDVDAVPGLVTRTVGRALDLRGAALDVNVQGRDERLAIWGHLDGPVIVRQLTHAGERVGRLVVFPHRDGVSIDLAVLDPLLPSVAATVAATGLLRQLASAHQHVREVRDHERIRLRDDLHDELGPSLAGIRLAVHAARTLQSQTEHVAASVTNQSGNASGLTAAASATSVDTLLGRAETELAHASEVIVSILEDLRPEVLADGGLVAAVRARASDFDRPGEFRVSVDSDVHLPPLSPTVEVAVLRLASEAICNAARHSGGTSCLVSMTAKNGGVALTVTDDGMSIPLDRRRGVGLESMATRTASVGGTLSIRSGAHDGTEVAAWFPLADSDSPTAAVGEGSASP